MKTALIWHDSVNKRKDLPLLPENCGNCFDSARLKQGQVIELNFDDRFEAECKITNVKISFWFKTMGEPPFVQPGADVTQWVTIVPLWDEDEEMVNDNSFIHNNSALVDLG